MTRRISRRALFALSGSAALLAACGAEKPTLRQDGTVVQTNPNERLPDFPAELKAEWRTDFSRTAVSFAELRQGQTKDGIPAITEPQFIPAGAARFLTDREPVIAFGLDQDVRAYPLQILIWHEIVNDTVNGMPVLVTFCPLCNTAIAFDRTVNGRTLDFGVSGFLRNSDLVMFDHQSESWWQQITGEALVGEYAGTRLELLPSSIVSWAEFRDAFPQGKVLARKEGFRPYGTNPYVGYDDIHSSPFLYDGSADARLSPMERVVTVENGAVTVAYPFSRLLNAKIIEDQVGSRRIVVLYKTGTASPLDKSAIAGSRDIGSAAVFQPYVGAMALHLRSEGGSFIDSETGSHWDIFGRAVSGPLYGAQLPSVVSGNHFWFAWVAFKPGTRVWGQP